jgi:ribosomal protein L11 methyltransferase
VTAIRRIVLRVKLADLERALDRVLPLLPDGVHIRRDTQVAELVALEGDAGPISAAALEQAAADLLLARAREDEIADLDAELNRLRPRFLVGDRFVVRHPDGEPVPDRVEILIARAQGFGSGAHPTTRMCLDLLERVEPRGDFADFGCGAGVLVIGAAKLGFAPATGIDMTPTVVEEAEANAARNGVDATFLAADLLKVDLPTARVVSANVSAMPVHERLADLGLPGTETLIMAGLPDTEAERAIARYEAAGFTETSRRMHARWLTARLDRAAA